MHTFRREWQGSVRGWTVEGDQPHHVIVWETSPEDRQFAFVWSGQSPQMYPEGTVFVPRPASWAEIEIHNAGQEPIEVAVEWQEGQGDPVRILGTAVRAGVVEPGDQVTTPTLTVSNVVAIRMHSHHAVHQTFTLAGQVVADTMRGHRVNDWIPARGSGPFNSTCTYGTRSGLGITKCFGCLQEMCNGYVMVLGSSSSSTSSYSSSSV